MEILEGLRDGFSVALDPMNLLFVVVGVVVGTTIGLLPGLGPTAAIAVLLPVTFHMDTASAIIMLAGIYYGAMYGGRIPAILLNLPGDASSVITTIEGYPLAKQGRGGPALGLTAIGSFTGGTIALVGLTLFAPLVAGFAAGVGPPETVVLALSGLLMASLISSGSKIKALLMAALGLSLASVGLDMIDGVPRLAFGSLELSSGIDIIPLAVGLFGLSEIIFLSEQKIRRSYTSGKLRELLPSREDLRISRVPILRSSIVGFFIGIIPGGGGALSSIVSYGLQKKMSKNPSKFGKGAVDGLAATETADNASSSAAFIPLLTLGLPPNSVLALLFGVLMMHNVTPGPNLITNHPEIFWGVIASMYIGNLILIVLNLPLVGVFTKILDIPPGVLFPLVTVIAFCGVYSANNSLFDVFLAVIFGIMGYLLKKFKFDMTPIILAFILGPVIEAGLRRSLVMGGGGLEIFFQRPGSLGIMIGFVIIVAVFLVSSMRKRREPLMGKAPEHAKIG